MNQNLWKSATRKGRRGQPRLIFLPKFFRYPAVALGVLMMLLALKVGVGHAMGGPAWQKVAPISGFAAYATPHSPKWDKSLTTLTSDNDDDDDDDGDDCTVTT
jgi:hypothetical protein